MEETLLGIVKAVKPLQPKNASSPIDVMLLGRSTEVKPLQLLNASLFIDSKLIKNRNSSNEVMVVFPLNNVPKSVTAAASASLNSPSLFVSQFATQIAFTLASAKAILGEGAGASTMPPLNTSSVQPAAMYASLVPYGTVNVHVEAMLLNA